jgi:hypothetical protein
MLASEYEAIRQMLEQARAAGEDEKVTFRLKGQAGAAAPSPEDTVQMAHALLERAAARHGHRQKRMTIFENLGSFVVQGDAALLLHLLDQPEVASAKVNRHTSAELIRPVRKGPATPKGWTDDSD